MFIPLLIVTFTISLAACFVVGKIFRGPIKAILGRIIGEELSAAWQRYITFAIYVVGVSGGVRIWELEKYITPRARENAPIELNAERWTLEVYRTLVETLQSIAWMLLVFFVFALIAFVITRAVELMHTRKVADQKGIAGGSTAQIPGDGFQLPATR